MSLFGAKRALFFAAHADDEMFCAGTLHRLHREGWEVEVLAFCQCGEQGDPKGERVSEQVREEFAESMSLIGAHGKCLEVIPESCFEERSQMVANVIRQKLVEFKPGLVISLPPTDDNHAHAVVGRQVRRVMRGHVPVLLECFVPWNTQRGDGRVFVSLDEEDVQVKQAVIACYKSQAFRYEYGRMFLGQVEMEGASVKVRAAERFDLVRAVL